MQTSANYINAIAIHSVPMLRTSQCQGSRYRQAPSTHQVGKRFVLSYMEVFAKSQTEEMVIKRTYEGKERYDIYLRLSLRSDPSIQRKPM